jgi:hypothetical protein
MLSNKKTETLFIGDSEIDKQCENTSEIKFIVIYDLKFDT